MEPAGSSVQSAGLWPSCKPHKTWAAMRQERANPGACWGECYCQRVLDANQVTPGNARSCNMWFVWWN